MSMKPPDPNSGVNQPSDPQPSDPAAGIIAEPAETYCYAHPKTPTKLRCSRCERPICGRCAIPASVGQHCPECVAEARKSAPKVRRASVAKSPVAVAIIVVTVISFMAQQILGGEYTFRLASIPQLIADGEWWRLITPVLVHANGLHIFFNMFVFYVYGQDTEVAFGHVQLFLVYLVSGITGSAFSFAFGSGAPSVGASGAVFGVVGALLVYLYNRRSSQFMAQHLQGIMGFLLLNTVIGFLLPNIDIMAHLGGLLGGVAMGFGFDRGGSGAKAGSPPALQIVTTVVVLVAAIALVLARSSAFG